MDKYRKIAKPKDTVVKDEAEIRVTAVGSVSAYVSRAAKVYNELNKPQVLITGTGNAITKAVQLAEVVKRRFKGLHQITKMGSQEIVDEYEPLEEGLDKVVDTRNISFVEIILSKDALDTADKGYQAPLDEAEVKEYSEEEMTRARGRGAGRGRGKGKGKGSPKGKGKGKSKSRDSSPAGKGKGKGKGKESSPKGKGKGKDKGKGKGYEESPKGKGKSKSKGKSKGGKDDYYGNYYEEPKGKSKGRGKERDYYEEPKGKGKGKEYKGGSWYGSYDAYPPMHGSGGKKGSKGGYGGAYYDNYGSSKGKGKSKGKSSGWDYYSSW